MKYYTYIMTNKLTTVLYIGVTNNLPRRVYEHKTGVIEGFTKQYKVHKLIYAEEYSDIMTAIQREKQLKGWIRKRKEELINSVNPEWEEIVPY